MITNNCLLTMADDVSKMANYSSVTYSWTAVNDSIEEDKYFYLWEIRRDLLRVVLPLIVILGTFGNTFALLVLFRRRMRTKSVYFYLAVLACADTIVLYVSAFKHWIRLITDFEFLHISNMSCKVLIFVILSSQHISAWLIVLLTIDRFLSVWQPFLAATFCTVARARVMTAILLIIVSLYNLHVFWTFQLFEGHPKPMCMIDKDSPFYYIFDYLKTITYCLFPSVIVLVLNAGIIYKIKARKSVLINGQKRDVVQGPDSLNVVRRKNRVTSMLLIISFVWVFLTTPYGALSVSRSLFEGGSRSLLAFLIAVCFLLFYLNHSVNFYLYCLTGKKIRKEFQELFLYICKCSRQYTGWRSANRTHKTQRTPLAYADFELKNRSNAHRPKVDGALPEFAVAEVVDEAKALSSDST